STAPRPRDGPEVVPQRPGGTRRTRASADHAAAGSTASQNGSRPKVALAPRAWGSDSIATAARKAEATTSRAGQSAPCGREWWMALARRRPAVMLALQDVTMSLCPCHLTDCDLRWRRLLPGTGTVPGNRGST